VVAATITQNFQVAVKMDKMLSVAHVNVEVQLVQVDNTVMLVVVMMFQNQLKELVFLLQNQLVH